MYKCPKCGEVIRKLNTEIVKRSYGEYYIEEDSYDWQASDPFAEDPVKHTCPKCDEEVDPKNVLEVEAI